MDLSWRDLSEAERAKARELYSRGMAFIEDLKNDSRSSPASRQIERLAKALSECGDAALERLNFQDPFIASHSWPDFAPIYLHGRDFVSHLRHQVAQAGGSWNSRPGRHKNYQFIWAIEFLKHAWLARADIGDVGIGQKISSDLPSAVSSFKTFLIDCVLNLDPTAGVRAPRLVESALEALGKKASDFD